MSAYDLATKNRVTWSEIPDWMAAAAEEGLRFAQKCFPSPRPRPSIKWFRGGPGFDFYGLFVTLDPDTVWLDATLRSYDAVLETAAHEHAHALGGYTDEFVPLLVGQMAVKNRRDGTVYIHRGDLKYNWMPDDARAIPAGAMVLELESGDANAYRNRGTDTRPRWERFNP